MARSVFFSFHYGNDVSRAMIVRNSGVTKTGLEDHGVIDKAEFEEIERKGHTAVEGWIDKQLMNTTVTVVLIGSETLQRPFVIYEIEQSKKRGNAIIGVYINKIKDFNQNTSTRCSTLGFPYKVYDWVDDDGYNNLGNWVESAAKTVGK
jgi:hypothetical protein